MEKVTWKVPNDRQSAFYLGSVYHNRKLLGETKGTEEEFGKKIKDWYNGIKDRDFEDVQVVSATRSPVLAKMREETVTLLKEMLAPEKVKKLRGDYRRLAEKTLVTFEIKAVLPILPLLLHHQTTTIFFWS